METLNSTVQQQEGWWQKAAGVAALAASLALTGCEANSGPVRIEPIAPSAPTLIRDNSITPRSELGVYQLDAIDIAKNVANFLVANPDLRIIDLEGNGNGGYGRNTHYSIVTRPALPNEAEQKVDIVHSSDPVQAAFRYKDLNPGRQISTMAGDGDGAYGRNTFYVFVSQKTE